MPSAPSPPPLPDPPPQAPMPIDPRVLAARSRQRRRAKNSGFMRSILTGPQGLVRRSGVNFASLLGTGSLGGGGATLGGMR